jgi:carbon-monoxide dehydrogenase catalytic subunit
MRSAIGFAPVPTITGAPNLVRLLTQECVGVTGGLLDVETDAIKAVKGILGHIETKRTGLGI